MLWNFASHDAAEALTARDDFVSALSRVRVESGTFGAQIVFCELVGNVIKHAPGPIRITLDVRDDDAVLRVHDQGPGFLPYAVLPTDLYAESGRGLLLIQQFCSELRVEISTTHGTSVCAHLPLAKPQIAARM